MRAERSCVTGTQHRRRVDQHQVDTLTGFREHLGERSVDHEVSWAARHGPCGKQVERAGGTPASISTGRRGLRKIEPHNLSAESGRMTARDRYQNLVECKLTSGRIGDPGYVLRPGLDKEPR